MKDVINQVDFEIRSLVKALRDAGIETDWSCSGMPGHMVIRPTIEARTIPFPSSDYLGKQKAVIDQVMRENNIKNYWLSLTWGNGAVNTHGGEPVWLIQIAGRFDFLALPVGYSTRYQDETDTILEFEK